MKRRTKFYSLLCFGFVTSLILIQSGLNYLSRESSLGNLEITNHNGLPDAENVMQRTRLKIKYSLRNYNFTRAGVDELEDLLVADGGNPSRNVIISSWRSGSSFLGDLLSANPGTFYNYEPFIHYKHKQLRGPIEQNTAITVLKSLLKCDFSEREHYFQFIKSWGNRKFITRNKRFAEACMFKNDMRLCYDANFTAVICKLFPFQVSKLVRMRLRLVENVLDDTGLAARVVFLIRDPRGVIRSRLQRLFNSPDSINPDVVCADMVDDYEAARRLIKKYPERVRVIRFEDLALNLNKTTLELITFLRFDYTQSIKEFIINHTKTISDDPYSTFRVTKNVPFAWKNAMQFEKVLEIQEACKKAMNLWGYKLAGNASHMSSADFNPLEPYSLR